MMLRLDTPTGALDLDEHVVERVRDTAAAMAGRSSAAREVSLVLDRALSRGQGVALRRVRC
jgi:alkylated DNA nucleotide flippase Atl1